ncbi:hypothetical protein [Actinospica robiniae]|uniref:hypothetical protein n=1 Tax=Actinospica robiniae TaxID=304901 RepID=UPI000417C581|nr:hypothetical protein [Actinospica robiniae]
MTDKPLKVIRGQWSETIVCGASGTGRTRFAYKLADRYNGHVVDSSDVLVAAKAMAGEGQHPELFYRDAEDWRAFPEGETPATAQELAEARFRAADVLFPAVKAVQVAQPRLHLDDYFESPHTVVTGRHALPALGFDFVVLLMETEEQIRANLRSRSCPDDVLDLRVRTSMLVQAELVRRAQEHKGRQPHCDVIFTQARPWEDVVERAYTAMSDWWDYRTALGGMW